VKACGPFPRLDFHGFYGGGGGGEVNGDFGPCCRELTK